MRCDAGGVRVEYVQSGVDGMRMRLAYCVLLLALACLTVLPVCTPVRAQSTVTSLDNALSVDYPQQRLSFTTYGVLWVFYEAASTLKYRYSSDYGDTWSGVQSAGMNTGTDGKTFSICFDGVYVHIVEAGSVAGSVFYKRGTPNADGSITFDATDAVVSGATARIYPTIAVDSNGYPWLAYTHATSSMYVGKSSTKDGTWTTDFLSSVITSGGASSITGQIVGLTNGRMALVSRANTGAYDIRITPYNGAAWGGVADTVMGAADGSWSCVTQGDDVHVMFNKVVTYEIEYTKYTYSTNSFSAELELNAGGGTLWPLSIQQNTSNDDLYVYFGNPVTDIVYYSWYDAVGLSWTLDTVWVNESVLDLFGDMANSDFTCDTGYCGAYYTADATLLKYKAILEAASVTTNAATAVQQETATLNGDVTATGTGAIIERGFQYNTTSSAVGAITVSETGIWAMGAYDLIIYDLEPSTTYYFRAFAVNNWGTVYGTWESFTTLAEGAGTLTVETLDATYITQTTALLNGKITDVGTNTVTAVGFDWGPTADYGYSFSEAGTFAEFEYFSHNISGLQPGLTYHFRARGVDAAGDSYGEDMMFMTGAPDSNGYIDITISEICGNEYEYIGVLGNLSHVSLISAGAINSCANNTLMVVPGMATSYWTPDQALIGVLIDSLGTYETKVVRYYLGVEDQQEDFDLVLGMGNESRVTHGDLPALEGGARFGFEVSGYLDASNNTPNTYLIWKEDAFKLWIPSDGNITAQIGNDAAPTVLASVAGVSSGRHTITVENTNVSGWLRLYLDGALMNTQADAAMPDNANPWYFFGNNSMPSVEYITYDIAGVDTLEWHPECMISGNQTDDLVGTYDGNITWGVNAPCISVVIGPMTADPTYPDPEVPGVSGGVKPYEQPSDWFAVCTGEDLPFYTTFASASSEMGMTTQSLYLFMMMGVATAVGLGVLVFTGSLMLAFIACGLIMGAGVNACVVSLWMVFTYGVMGISVLILQKTG